MSPGESFSLAAVVKLPDTNQVSIHKVEDLSTQLCWSRIDFEPLGGISTFSGHWSGFVMGLPGGRSEARLSAKTNRQYSNQKPQSGDFPIEVVAMALDKDLRGGGRADVSVSVETPDPAVRWGSSTVQPPKNGFVEITQRYETGFGKLFKGTVGGTVHSTNSDGTAGPAKQVSGKFLVPTKHLSQVQKSPCEVDSITPINN